jgi:fumarate reductase subunit D
MALLLTGRAQGRTIKKDSEVRMFAYLLLLAAVLSHLLPHAGWYGFTAVGGSLLYFGARRNWVEMVVPVALLAGADYYLTAHVYGYPFIWQAYVVTWAWYLGAMALGRGLLRDKATLLRGVAAALLGPTSFFLLSNFAVWLGTETLYPKTAEGLFACFVAGLPFYGRDLISTALVLTMVFALPAGLRHWFSQSAHAKNLA